MEKIISKIIEHNLSNYGRIPCVIDDRFLWIDKYNIDLIINGTEYSVTMKFLENELFKDISYLNVRNFQYISFYTKDRLVCEVGLLDLDDFIITDQKQFEERISSFGLIDSYKEWNKTYKGGFDNTFKTIVERNGKYHFFSCLEDGCGRNLYYEHIYEGFGYQKNNPEFIECLNNCDDDFQCKVRQWINGDIECPLEPYDLVIMDDGECLAAEVIWYETKIKAAE